MYWYFLMFKTSASGENIFFPLMEGPSEQGDWKGKSDHIRKAL